LTGRDRGESLVLTARCSTRDLHAQGSDAIDFYTHKKIVVERWPALTYSSPPRWPIGSKRTRTRAGSTVTMLPFSKASTS